MRITLSAEDRDYLAKAASFARLSASFEGSGEYGRYSRPLDIGALADLERMFDEDRTVPGSRTYALAEDLASAAQAALFFTAQQIDRYVEMPSTLHPIRAQMIEQRFGSDRVERVSERMTALGTLLASRHRRVRPTVSAAHGTEEQHLVLGGRSGWR